jgi:hypothetical protein
MAYCGFDGCISLSLPREQLPGNMFSETGKETKRIRGGMKEGKKCIAKSLRTRYYLEMCLKVRK